MNTTFKKTLLTLSSILISVTTINAHANLISTDGGLGVYDTGLDATWTQDANLLGTWEGAYQSTSYTNIVTAIINASGGVIHDTPNVYDNGTYNLTTADFGSGGTVDWWAGQALVHYLDTQKYGGSSQWALPTSNAVLGYDNSSQLGELFYNELGGTAGSSMPSNPFSNFQASLYWTGMEYSPYRNYAWSYSTNYGGQTYYFKDSQFYAWAVSPGQVNAVPVPGAVWLFGSALVGLIGFNRRNLT
jgi:hypothetical protein